MIIFRDFLPASIENGAARITSEGYLVADALVGRAGNVQEYRAAELGDAFADRAPGDIVRVYRPEAEVFAVDSLRSASRLPITLDHPVQNGRGVFVDARNFREFARGETGEQIMRDGEFIRVPIRVTDAGAVASVQTARREFSLGYAAEIVVGDGVSPAGELYDASLVNIRYNHLAACRAARGGPELRITDERTKGKPMLIIIDGRTVDLSDANTAAATITALIAARDTAVQGVADAQALVDARDATIAERDATIANMRDAAAKPLDPAALRDAAAAFARVTAKAKALGATITDAMGLPEIMQAAVAHKMGDAAASYTDAQYAAAFDALAVAVTDEPGTDPLRAGLADGDPVNIGDAATAAAAARAARITRLSNAHKGAQA